jgi:hypothetical protein
VEKHGSAIHPEVVHGWFQEWQNSKLDRQRLKPLPSEVHCRPIAKALSDAIPTQVDQTVGLTPAQMEAALYRSYFDKLNEAIASLSPAMVSLERAEKLWNGLAEPKVTLPEGFENLLNGIRIFLKYVPRDHDSIDFAFDLDANIFSDLTAKALFDCGWKQKNISLYSDNGPVMFVVARCLEKIWHKSLSPATLGRQLRSAAKTRKLFAAKNA